MIPVQTTYGYTRVSTRDQSPKLQIDALRAAGVATRQIHSDACSGALPMKARVAMHKLLQRIKPDDVLMVWRLDRLARSLPMLLEFLAELEGRSVRLVSLTDPIDTRTATGRFTAQMFGALAQFERGQMRERQAAGIAAARARGQALGRTAALGPVQVQAAYRLDQSGETQRSIAKALGVSRSTVNAALRGLPPYNRLKRPGGAV